MPPNFGGEIVALKIYCRRRKECESERTEDFKNGKLEEGSRGSRRCTCLIHASGTVAGKFHRQSTAERDWEKQKPCSPGGRRPDPGHR
jgi:hypothetical protein